MTENPDGKRINVDWRHVLDPKDEQSNRRTVDSETPPANSSPRRNEFPAYRIDPQIPGMTEKPFASAAKASPAPEPSTEIQSTPDPAVETQPPSTTPEEKKEVAPASSKSFEQLAFEMNQGIRPDRNLNDEQFTMDESKSEEERIQEVVAAVEKAINGPILKAWFKNGGGRVEIVFSESEVGWDGLEVKALSFNSDGDRIYAYVRGGGFASNKREYGSGKYYLQNGVLQNEKGMTLQESPPFRRFVRDGVISQSIIFDGIRPYEGVQPLEGLSTEEQDAVNTLSELRIRIEEPMPLRDVEDPESLYDAYDLDRIKAEIEKTEKVITEVEAGLQTVDPAVQAAAYRLLRTDYTTVSPQEVTAAITNKITESKTALLKYKNTAYPKSIIAQLKMYCNDVVKNPELSLTNGDRGLTQEDLDFVLSATQGEVQAEAKRILQNIEAIRSYKYQIDKASSISELLQYMQEIKQLGVYSFHLQTKNVEDSMLYSVINHLTQIQASTDEAVLTKHVQALPQIFGLPGRVRTMILQEKGLELARVGEYATMPETKSQPTESTHPNPERRSVFATIRDRVRQTLQAS